jgi:hypothetical protein
MELACNAWGTRNTITDVLNAGRLWPTWDYLTRLLAPSEQQYGANAPATQDLREQFEDAKKEETNPPKQQRFVVGFRKLYHTSVAE